MKNTLYIKSFQRVNQNIQSENIPCLMYSYLEQTFRPTRLFMMQIRIPVFNHCFWAVTVYTKCTTVNH